MGTQQLLLIIIGVIIIAIGISVGAQLFGATSVSSNRDALMNDINNFAANVKQYRSKISSMGGGGGSYTGYLLPAILNNNDDGSFSLAISPASVVITATSAMGFGTVEATIDSNGATGNWSYTGDFSN
ncbi:MAG TPA: hypothetical protein VJO14_04225 [Bacteroidota bacterium]|nr:hypothetical protein [Bacteroidota bacterium]